MLQHRRNLRSGTEKGRGQVHCQHVRPLPGFNLGQRLHGSHETCIVKGDVQAAERRFGGSDSLVMRALVRYVSDNSERTPPALLDLRNDQVQLVLPAGDKHCGGAVRGEQRCGCLPNS